MVVSTRGKNITYSEAYLIEDVDDDEDQEKPPVPKKRKKMKKEDYCYTSKMKRRKRKKKDVDEGPKPPPSGKGRRLLGKLANLMNMPIEIFAEICSHLHPVDLLHLARSSTRLRTILMTKDSVSLWRTSRQNQVRSLPDCPDDLSEPQYAALVFTSVCQACAGLRAVRVHYGLRTRHCIRCYPEHIIKEEKVSSLGLGNISGINFRDIIPSIKAIEPGKTFGSEYTWYSVDTVKALDEKLGSLDDRLAREMFLDAQSRVVEKIEEHAAELNKWQYKQDCKLETEGQDIRTARIASIKKKLQELGWESKDFPRSRGSEEDREWHQLLDRRQPLSEKIWNNLKPRLLEILEITRIRRVEAEEARQRDERREGRRKALEKFYKSLREEHREEHFDIFFPDWGSEAMGLDPIKELLDDDERSTVARDRWDAKKHIVLDELKILTVWIERRLASWYSWCLANTGTNATAMTSSGDLDFSDSTVGDYDNGGQIQSEPGSLVDIRSPTTVFTCAQCEETLWYPTCLKHAHFRFPSSDIGSSRKWDAKYGPFRTRFISSLPQIVSGLLDELGLDRTVMTTLDLPITMPDALALDTAPEAMYFCLLCDEQLRSSMTFAQLVVHIHEEQAECVKAQQEIDSQERDAFQYLSKSKGIPELINDHSLSERRIPGMVLKEVLSDEELMELSERRAEFKNQCKSFQAKDFHGIVSKYWKKGGGDSVTCRLCPSSMMKKRMEIYWVVAHLRAKHGVDVESRIAQKRQDVKKRQARATLKSAHHPTYTDSDNDMDEGSIDGDLIAGYDVNEDDGDSD